jgi:hypothetical protein
MFCCFILWVFEFAVVNIPFRLLIHYYPPINPKVFDRQFFSPRKSKKSKGLRPHSSLNVNNKGAIPLFFRSSLIYLGCHNIYELL